MWPSGARRWWPGARRSWPGVLPGARRLEGRQEASRRPLTKDMSGLLKEITGRRLLAGDY